MRNLRGFIWTAVFLVLTGVLVTLAITYGDVLFMAYPYFSRTAMSFLETLTSWTSVNLWQLGILLALVAAILTLVATIAFRWNFLRWLGGVTLAAGIVLFLFMGVYGLNYFGNPLAIDMKLEVEDYSTSTLKEATIYYRDQANALARRVPRDAEGNLKFDSFEILAQTAPEGFEALAQHYSIFAGSMAPVKRLGFSDLFNRLGITGITVGLTGEACVDPNVFSATLPFTMCHEMSHRNAIAVEKDANFAAYLACEASSDLQFRYSGYFEAYIYCINALWEVDPAAANEVQGGITEELARDLIANNEEVRQYEGTPIRDLGQNVNNTYLQAMGQEEGTESYEFEDLLVNWYLVNFDPDREVEEEPVFDPYHPVPATEPADG